MRRLVAVLLFSAVLMPAQSYDMDESDIASTIHKMNVNVDDIKGYMVTHRAVEKEFMTMTRELIAIHNPEVDQIIKTHLDRIDITLAGAVAKSVRK